MIWLGDILNLAVCLAILVCSFVFYFWQLAPACEVQGEGARGYAVSIQRPFCYWMLSWVLWVFLYVFRILERRYPVLPPESLQFLILVCSDVNSIYHCLAAYALIRGAQIGPTHMRLLCIGTVFTVLAYDFVNFLLGGMVGGAALGTVFLTPFSAALSLGGALVLGLAITLRYRSILVVIVASMYALTQPFAYGVVFSISETRSVPVSVDSGSDLSAGFEEYVVETGREKRKTHYLVTRRGHAGMDERDEEKLLNIIKQGTSIREYWGFVARFRIEEITFSVLAARGESLLTGMV